MLSMWSGYRGFVCMCVIFWVVKRIPYSFNGKTCVFISLRTPQPVRVHPSQVADVKPFCEGLTQGVFHICPSCPETLLRG